MTASQPGLATTSAAPAPAGLKLPVPLPADEDVLVRPVVPDDADALAAAFARLSLRSRYQRFFTGVPCLTTAQLDYLTTIDHHNHEALAAVIPATGEIIGVARFIRSRTRHHSAELAVTIADQWQQRGIGTELLHRLVNRALDEGITELTADILSENRAMLALSRHGGRIATTMNGTTTTVTIDIEP